MGWFSKKENVPEIPPAPKLPELPRELSTELSKVPEKSTHELPSLPNNLGENLNREIVKSAVIDTEPSEEKEVKMEELPRNFRVKEERKLKAPEIPAPQKPLVPAAKKMPEFSMPMAEKKTKPTEPIFVRIDKFQAAQKEFDEVKSKIKEVESTVKIVKEVKLKEDAEISELISELEKIKSKIAEIDSNIFDKI